MEVFSLQWLLLNYSAKFLRTIKLNYAYCNQRRLFIPAWTYYTLLFHSMPRSFKHIAVKSTFQRHCSTAYQLFYSNPHLNCSICTFCCTLKWQRYLHEVLYLLAGAQILHPISELLCLCLLKKSCGCQVVSTWDESKCSSYDYTGCVFNLSVFQIKGHTKHNVIVVAMRLCRIAIQ